MAPAQENAAADGPSRRRRKEETIYGSLIPSEGNRAIGYRRPAWSLGDSGDCGEGERGDSDNGGK